MSELDEKQAAMLMDFARGNLPASHAVRDAVARAVNTIGRLRAAAPSGEPDALTRGERAELLAWRRANDLRADWEAHLNARDEAWRLRAENEAASGRVSEKAVRSSDSDPADMSPEQWDALVGVAGASVNPDDDAPPAGRAAAEPPAWYWHNFGAAVWRWLADHWDGEDGWEIGGLAVEAGLAEYVAYDPEKHGDCDAEPGDEIIYPLRGDPLPMRAAEAPDMVAVRRDGAAPLLREAAEALYLVGNHGDLVARLRAAAERAAEGPR